MAHKTYGGKDYKHTTKKTKAYTKVAKKKSKSKRKTA